MCVCVCVCVCVWCVCVCVCVRARRRLSDMYVVTCFLPQSKDKPKKTATAPVKSAQVNAFW